MPATTPAETATGASPLMGARAGIADYTYAGLWRALAILGAWAALLAVTLFLIPPMRVFPIVLFAVPLQMFFNVGLFITAHDAMHGTLLPHCRMWNERIGRLAIFLYGFFSFAQLRKQHWAHHAHPASENDPDFHRGGSESTCLEWYFHFLGDYVSWRQWLGMPAVFSFLHFLAGVGISNILLFWALPALLSSFQLFYFGTYLPHRRPVSGYLDEHRATSCNFSPTVSFFTCYHFGRHWQHHAQPQIPWWRLGRQRTPQRDASYGTSNKSAAE